MDGSAGGRVDGCGGGRVEGGRSRGGGWVAVGKEGGCGGGRVVVVEGG